ncbi:ornithine carbamoyltransferase [Bacillus marasmi]|uniref:ornithine carbamoyltransferase n=1 Tax=Bacillus marasmi TaxID=1926279 RepID=UPI0011C765CB|nr:ornithine carbamoyltransferase [Bacillus marasmi]
MIQTYDTQLKGKDLLTLKDLPAQTIQALVERAIKLKQEKLAGIDHGKPLAGKILGMIFEKSSTRTRVSFEAGMLQLGGQAIVMNSKDLQIGRGEPISDTAKVMSHYIDGIMIRTFSHSIIEELAEHATIPVINGLTDLYHPCQALADLQTVYEQKGKFAGLKMAYIGDGNNVAHSLMIACAKMGMDIAIASPKGYEPDAEVTEAVHGFAAESGAKVLITNDPVAAIKDADAVYADVWTSMGQEEENEIRLKAFEGFQINDELVKHAKSDYIFLHCLPAHREEEVSASVIDGPNSAVFEQAGNRLHAQKALLVEILKD